MKTVMNLQCSVNLLGKTLHGGCRNGVLRTGVSSDANENCELGTCRLQRTGAKCFRAVNFK